MGTNLTSAFSWNANRISLPRALKKAAAVATVGCLLSGSFVAAVSYSGAATSEQTGDVSVNRTNKGDRLPSGVILRHTLPLSSPAVSTAPPIGCDPAFSRAAEPGRAHIFGRCIT